MTGAVERWTIYKRTGEWDDVIEGPDTGEEHDGGVEVVPASEADRLRRVLERIADYDEVSLGRTLAQDALGRLGPNQG
jgi:hypothetical protein